MNADNEKNLTSQLMTGNADAFNLFFIQYQQKIFNLALRMTGNAADAEDITQETFITVHKSIKNFQGKSKLSTWLYTIAKNLCLKSIQKQKKGCFSDIEFLINESSIPYDTEDYGVSQFEKQYLVKQVKEGCLTGLLKCLSYHQRLTFVFHVLLELSIKETSEVVDKTEGAVKVLIHRARQNLKGFLCQNCSLYDSRNICRCENLVHFSLKQGWIKKPSGESLQQTSTISSDILEDEINELDKVVRLFKSLPDQESPQILKTTIKKYLQNVPSNLFSEKKV